MNRAKPQEHQRINGISTASRYCERARVAKLDTSLSTICREFTLSQVPEVLTAARMRAQLGQNFSSFNESVKDYRSDYINALAQELGYN